MQSWTFSFVVQKSMISTTDTLITESMCFISVRNLEPLSLLCTSSADCATLHAETAHTCSADTPPVSPVWSGRQSMSSSWLRHPGTVK
jgi:hypothetical protein